MCPHLDGGTICSRPQELEISLSLSEMVVLISLLLGILTVLAFSRPSAHNYTKYA